MPFAAQRVVVDTNVLFEGLTKRNGSARALVELCLTGVVEPCASNALLYEYTEVLTRKLSEARWQGLRPVLGVFLKECRFIDSPFSWRPVSPDPSDDHIIECALNARACVVTRNLKDFRLAESPFGLPVLTPEDYLLTLYLEDEGLS